MNLEFCTILLFSNATRDKTRTIQACKYGVIIERKNCITFSVNIIRVARRRQIISIGKDKYILLNYQMDLLFFNSLKSLCD